MKMIMQLKTTEAGVIRHNMQVPLRRTALSRAAHPASVKRMQHHNATITISVNMEPLFSFFFNSPIR
jgi:hypothetical protein